MAHVVRVTSVAPPTISGRCPRCPSDEFVCSDLFRLNTHGKVADVWLIYRCARCDATKNITVVERTPVPKIAPATLEAALTNDVSIARRLARDVGLLRRNGTAARRGDVYRLEGVCPPNVDGLELAFNEPLLVRVDDVVASALGMSRSALRRAMDSGLVVVSADRPSRLRLTSGVDVALRRGDRVPAMGRRSFVGDRVTISFDADVCQHSGNCLNGLAAVFDAKQKPWINPDGASEEEVIAQVARCPSGALRIEPTG